MSYKILTFLFLSVTLISCGSGEGVQSYIDESTNGSSTNSVSDTLGWLSTPELFVSNNASELVVEATQEAINNWNTQYGRELLTYGGRVTTDALSTLYQGLDDSVSVVYEVQEWATVTQKSDSVLGTTIFETVDDHMVKSDILLNYQNYAWVDAKNGTIDEQNQVSENYVDLSTVLVHEIGHYLGASHTESGSDSVMTPSTSIGFDSYNRLPTSIDVSLMQRLYP